MLVIDLRRVQQYQYNQFHRCKTKANRKSLIDLLFKNDILFESYLTTVLTGLLIVLTGLVATDDEVDEDTYEEDPVFVVLLLLVPLLDPLP